VDEDIGRELGDDGRLRNVLLFHLGFEPGQGRRYASQVAVSRRDPDRRPRPFDPSRSPAYYRPPDRVVDEEQRQARLEKANAGHHALLSRLAALLERSRWTEIEEIPAAIDLWARSRDGRVIFEAKTISETNELHQSRAAIAQLLEYRLEYGVQEDSLCTVVDERLSIRRARLLDALGIAAIYVPESGDCSANNDAGASIVALLAPAGTQAA
jgi:hypothetical protein